MTTKEDTKVDAAQAMTCRRCGRVGPIGAFCTWCGEHHADTPMPTMAGRRAARYAAHPQESVTHPGVLTTLMPHLSSRGVRDFRWALMIGVLGVTILSLAGLTLGALLASAILVPVLYVLYLYEARVYRDSPIRVTALTLGGGALLGAGASLVLNALAGSRSVSNPTPFGGNLDFSALAFVAILVPIVQELLKPLPALALRRRPEFWASVDGLTLGIASGLGFAAAESVIQFSRLIATLPLYTDPSTWLFPLIGIAIVKPLLHGSTTGLITLALWHGSSGPMRTRALLIAVAVGAHILFVVGTELLGAAEQSLVYTLAWQVLVVGAVLLAVRLQLHRTLLEEASDLGLARTTCPNCENRVIAATFCPVCGMAQTAVPIDTSRARQAVDARVDPEAA